MSNEDTKRPVVSFAAIDPFITRNIVTPTERQYSGQERVTWGPGDKYPGYIIDLYETCPTLHSVIGGCVDFIVGDEVLFKGDPTAIMNDDGDNPAAVVRALALSAVRLGGISPEVVRAKDGSPLQIYPLDISTIRSNKDNSVFWYSKKWGKSNADPVRMSAFMPSVKEMWSKMDEDARNAHASSIYYVKNDDMRTYPVPCFNAAVKDCETERSISDYFLNTLDNGFAASAIINFTNGIPDDKTKAEIEKDINEKFGGHANAGRIAVNFAPSKENMAIIQTLKSEDFGERYEALQKHVRQQIFTSFRASPVLFGIPTENNGFAADNYKDAFMLFNRTFVQPIQQMIIDAFTYIYGEEVLEIRPFTLSENDTVDTLAVQLGVGGTQSMMSVLESTTLSEIQKRGALRVLFGLDEESINDLLGIASATVTSES
ncbi:MAG: phage portal protein [Bacteroidales bacterium]|nr:phage portal protein [Bacteroidales bacterium]